ncbi:hypothetical protein HanIR_Chr01g0012811 [Helianthus annuus]|nr:hypothetical protein HanIR_Chr01g0012811 [Helianthus annuus]
MFDRFRTRYNWDQANDEAIREGFENVLKRRFADIMSDYRKESTKKARVAGHDFPDDRLDFEAMRKFPPRFVHLDVWDKLCMERALGWPPTFRELFLATHLTKESKKDFWDGLFDESLEGAEFCTTRSRLAYEAYERSMVEKYREDVLLHPVGDADLWERAQGRSGFGIGSSDPCHVSSLMARHHHPGLRPMLTSSAHKSRCKTCNFKWICCIAELKRHNNK